MTDDKVRNYGTIIRPMLISFENEICGMVVICEQDEQVISCEAVPVWLRRYAGASVLVRSGSDAWELV